MPHRSARYVARLILVALLASLLPSARVLGTLPASLPPLPRSLRRPSP
jgi:hypothetical protein